MLLFTIERKKYREKIEKLLHCLQIHSATLIICNFVFNNVIGLTEITSQTDIISRVNIICLASNLTPNRLQIFQLKREMYDIDK